MVAGEKKTIAVSLFTRFIFLKGAWRATAEAEKTDDSLTVRLEHYSRKTCLNS